MTRPTHPGILLAAAVAFIGFIALGTWQVERRSWKLALIERVDQRVHAPAAPLPPRAQWPMVNAADDEYRHVRAAGRYAPGADTLVQAVTERGAGFWVLTPLQLDDGSTLLIDRGFVPAEAKDRIAPAVGSAMVTGLLRLSEPGGGFLRHNETANERWYSRDVQAIAAARGLTRPAPFFVDADAQAADAQATDAPATGVQAPDARPADVKAADPARAPGGLVAPIGGLTVIAFHNSHLVYAITWYTLAAMVAAAVWRLMREGRRGDDD